MNNLSFLLSIPWANIATALALVASLFIFWRKAREEHYDEMMVVDGWLVSIVIGVVSARLGFVLLHFSQFQFAVLEWVNVASQPGLSWWLGVLGASWALVRYAQVRRWDVWEVLDFWVMSTTLAMTMVWFGWLLAGVRFGVETSLPWGMIFPGVLTKHHPTQLYAFFSYAVLFWYLAWLEYRYRTFEWYKAHRKSAQTGFLVGVFFIGQGIISGALSLLMPPQLQLLNVRLDTVLAGASVVIGVLIIAHRAGRISLPWAARG